MIKLFGWEQKISDRIAKQRDAELQFVWKTKVLELLVYIVTCVALTDCGSATNLF